MMGVIVKLGPDQYLLWSTLSDAPVTHVMTRQSMLNWLLANRDLRDDAPEVRMERTDQNGTSTIPGESMEDFIRYNRAGPEGKTLTVEEILEKYASINIFG